jgi:hypothetical protein
MLLSVVRGQFAEVMQDSEVGRGSRVMSMIGRAAWFTRSRVIAGRGWPRAAIVTKRPLESQPRRGRIRAFGAGPETCLGHALESLPATQELGESRRGRAAHRTRARRERIAQSPFFSGTVRLARSRSSLRTCTLVASAAA